VRFPGDANAPNDIGRVETPTQEVKGAPQTAETMMATAKADAGKAQVAKMLARYQETTNKQAAAPAFNTQISVGQVKKFDASSIHAEKPTTGKTGVTIDKMDADSHIYKEPVYSKPTGAEHINRKQSP